MDFQIIKLPDHPVIVFQPTEHFKLQEALPVIINQVTTVLDAQTERVFYIADMRQARINLDDLLLSMTRVVFGDKPFLRHPNIREILLVTTNPLIHKVAGGLTSGMYGNIALQVMYNYEAALDYAIQDHAPDATKPPFGH